MSVVIACVKAEALCNWDRETYNFNLDGDNCMVLAASQTSRWGGKQARKAQAPGRQVNGKAPSNQGTSQQWNFLRREMQFTNTKPATCSLPSVVHVKEGV